MLYFLQFMKIFSFHNKKNQAAKRRKKAFADYQQNSINAYGKQQIKSLIDRGLSVQW